MPCVVAEAHRRGQRGKSSKPTPENAGSSSSDCPNSSYQRWHRVRLALVACLAACHMSSLDGVDVLALGVVGSWIPSSAGTTPFWAFDAAGCLDVGLVGPLCTALAGTPRSHQDQDQDLPQPTPPSRRRRRCPLPTSHAHKPTCYNMLQHTTHSSPTAREGQSEWWCFIFWWCSGGTVVKSVCDTG
ncbi:hypothetical protein F5B21DRAFT_53505 [Xylaria acuta]|nr:hypothetical protein F5B21DRAFT_53505 [Xylaria acuta]